MQFWNSSIYVYPIYIYVGIKMPCMHIVCVCTVHIACGNNLRYLFLLGAQLSSIARCLNNWISSSKTHKTTLSASTRAMHALTLESVVLELTANTWCVHTWYILQYTYVRTRTNMKLYIYMKLLFCFYRLTIVTHHHGSRVKN